MSMPLKEFITPFTNAEKSIDHTNLKNIPYFENVFEEDIWPTLTKLSGNGGAAHIEIKKFNPGEIIIKNGQFDMMVYWLVSGSAHVVTEINRKKTIVKKYKNTGDCFGELAVINECERSADVYSAKDSHTHLIEIDWSITEICRELDAKFSKLMLKTIARKLIDSYENTHVAYSLIKELKKN